MQFTLVKSAKNMSAKIKRLESPWKFIFLPLMRHLFPQVNATMEMNEWKYAAVWKHNIVLVERE